MSSLDDFPWLRESESVDKKVAVLEIALMNNKNEIDRLNVRVEMLEAADARAILAREREKERNRMLFLGLRVLTWLGKILFWIVAAIGGFVVAHWDKVRGILSTTSKSGGD